MTLNFGLRNEYVSAVSDAHHLVDYGYDATNAIVPRIGFAWSPQSDQGLLSKLTGGPGKTVLRSGFGMFHGRWFQSAFSGSRSSARKKREG